MTEELFNLLFLPDERVKIRLHGKNEPYNTMRKAFILFAYMSDCPEYEIGRCVNRNRRQMRYLLEKAEDLYSARDREMLKTIASYERKLE